MNCLIVDDEPLAIDLIVDFVKKVPFLNLLGTCKNAIEANEKIHKNKVDLLFLDIQMPNLSGIQLMHSLEKKPLVIFTTAYSEYAVESYDLNAIDYLLKPFTFERFLKAVNKAYSLYDNNETKLSEQLTNKKSDKFIFINADYKKVKINLDDILYIEGLSDYIKIYAGDKPILTLQSLKTMEEKLPEEQFIRVHRSFIVSLKKIESIQRNRIIIGKKRIPVGDNYKEEFYRRIERFNV
jgi:DNA-binding LytR/AlgR family response regulator